MKKGIFTLLSALALNAQAQITINSTNVGTIGSSMILATDTLATQGPGAAGANKTWNFSTLQAHVTDTLLLQSPTGKPNAANFPNSNVYLTYSGSSEGVFIIKNTTGAFLDGLADPAILVDYNPNEQMLAFPATFGTNFSNTSRIEISLATTSFPPADSVRIIENKLKMSNIDAWGTLTLSSGSFSTLRQKDEEHTHDSVFIHIPVIGWQYADESLDTNYHYSWWTNTQPYAILQLDSSSSGADGHTFLKTIPTSINDVAQLGAKIYPNPAKNVVHFETSANKVDAVLYDLKGSIVYRATGLNGNFDLSVSEYREGIYLYILTDENGKAAKGRIQVTH